MIPRSPGSCCLSTSFYVSLSLFAPSLSRDFFLSSMRDLSISKFCVAIFIFWPSAFFDFSRQQGITSSTYKHTCWRTFRQYPLHLKSKFSLSFLFSLSSVFFSGGSLSINFYIFVAEQRSAFVCLNYTDSGVFYLYFGNNIFGSVLFDSRHMDN